MSPDVVIVGAGITGCASAYALAQLGFKVEVLEKYHPAAMGSGSSIRAGSLRTASRHVFRKAMVLAGSRTRRRNRLSAIWQPASRPNRKRERIDLGAREVTASVGVESFAANEFGRNTIHCAADLRENCHGLILPLGRTRGPQSGCHGLPTRRRATWRRVLLRRGRREAQR